jgi:hypothetical protein
MALTRCRIAELEKRTDDRAPDDLMQVLKLEENTWALLQALMPSVLFPRSVSTLSDTTPSQGT